MFCYRERHWEREAPEKRISGQVLRGNYGFWEKIFNWNISESSGGCHSCFCNTRVRLEWSKAEHENAYNNFMIRKKISEKHMWLSGLKTIQLNRVVLNSIDSKSPLLRTKTCSAWFCPTFLSHFTSFISNSAISNTAQFRSVCLPWTRFYPFISKFNYQADWQTSDRRCHQTVGFIYFYSPELLILFAKVFPAM